MRKEVFRILVLNPGSTSTKAAVYDDVEEIANATLHYTDEQLETCGGVLGQEEMRMKDVMYMLEENHVPAKSLNAVVGRGGLLNPIDSGTYLINDRMLDDLRNEKAMVHASSLGGVIAHDIGKRWGIPAYIVDPVVVDELEPYARFSGIPEIERRSVFHALNSKAVARHCAEKIGISYENGRFIVAHMGGGVTIGAHRYGRVIDVNDAVSGDGPFTPDRSGSVPVKPMVELCFSGKYTKDEILDKVIGKGGMKAYLGVNDMREVEIKVKNGDEHAAMVMEAMAFQISKQIGAMAAVLEGRVNAIILTGGLAHSQRFVGLIKQRVSQFASVYTFPGEAEMLALAEGALRVLRGEEPPAIYQ